MDATFSHCWHDMNLRLQAAIQNWIDETMTALHLSHPPTPETHFLDDQICIDGKTVRGAAIRRERNTGRSEAGLHLFAAYAPALHLVLDQLAADNKGQELTLAKLILGQVPLKGRGVTGDALLTQRAICTAVTDGEGDYLFPVKENHPSLLPDIEEASLPLPLPPVGVIPPPWMSSRCIGCS